jgi:hypothetical protein
MAEKGEPSGGTTQTRTLVRGPDGALWLLSGVEAPKPVIGNEKERIESILTETEAKVSNVLAFGDMGVHVGDVFDGKGQHCEIPETSPD